MKAFVTVGVERKPFIRLLQAVDEAVRDGFLSRNTLVQKGHSPYVPDHCEWRQFLTFDEMVEQVKNADLVICHAGVGSVLLCRGLGRVPLIMPRQVKQNEHVDDHQQEFARIMADEGNAVLAEDPIQMQRVLADIPEILLKKNAITPDSPPLAQSLGDILTKLTVVENRP